MNESLRIDNILKLMRRGSFTLSGEEVLVFAQSYEYLLKKKEEIGKPPAQKLSELTMKEIGISDKTSPPDEMSSKMKAVKKK